MNFKNMFFHEVGVYTSDQVFDIDPVSDLYLYCKVIELRTVGHTLAPLLGVIPVSSIYYKFRPGFLRSATSFPNVLIRHFRTC